MPIFVILIILIEKVFIRLLNRCGISIEDLSLFLKDSFGIHLESGGLVSPDKPVLEIIEVYP